jgi:threonyl-tRNA synthetase
VRLDARSELMQKRIREAQLEKVPYMLIIGGREVTQKKVAVRTRTGGEQGTMTIEGFAKKVLEEVERKGGEQIFSEAQE